MNIFAELQAEYSRLFEAVPAAPLQGPRLPPHYGREALSRDIEIARQKRATREWLRNEVVIIRARKALEERRQAALEAEGLA